MFNTKNKREQMAVAVIDEIHRKVDTASERVLSEAKKILSSHQHNEKFERLQKLASVGFHNSKEVIEAQKDIDAHKLAEEKAKWIMHYKTLYPQKYILVEDMQQICKEYNLLLGSDRDYIDSIPEKNQKEIVNFKLREEDKIHYMGTVRVTSQTTAKGEGVVDWQEISKEQYNQETNNGQLRETGDVGFSRNSKKYFISNDDYFTIAATPNMFDLKGKIVEGVDIKKKVEWDDPIVLKAVKFGYIVVSVWGQELAIQKIRNEREN